MCKLFKFDTRSDVRIPNTATKPIINNSIENQEEINENNIDNSNMRDIHENLGDEDLRDKDVRDEELRDEGKERNDHSLDIKDNHSNKSNKKHNPYKESTNKDEKRSMDNKNLDRSKMEKKIENLSQNEKKEIIELFKNRYKNESISIPNEFIKINPIIPNRKFTTSNQTFIRSFILFIILILEILFNTKYLLLSFLAANSLFYIIKDIKFILQKSNKKTQTNLINLTNTTNAENNKNKKKSYLLFFTDFFNFCFFVKFFLIKFLDFFYNWNFYKNSCSSYYYNNLYNFATYCSIYN